MFAMHVHQWNKIFHRVVGQSVIPVGVVNVFFGLQVISPLDTNLQIQVSLTLHHVGHV
jgi:hypothetical protein